MTSAINNGLALHGGDPVRPQDRPWPGWPVFDDAERNALSEVLESGQWFYGERVARFEQEFAAFQGARHCISVTNGSTGAEIIIQALGLEPGDEVIVPPYTFIATVTAVMRMGATPIFADVDETWCLDPNAVEAAITPRTKAILPVHFGSRVADMDRLSAIAERQGLVVIEDACHSWGSQWAHRGTGVLGLAGFFSFQASKNMTAGEGGAIVTDDEAFADLCRSIANCGRSKDGPWYHHSVVGANARITEFAAALLSAQLTRLEEQTRRREENGAILDAALRDIEGLTPQPSDSRITRRARHLYCVRIDEEAFGCSRENFVAAARAEGLPISTGYAIPLYAQPVFKSFDRGPDYSTVHCPVAEDLCYQSGMWFGHPLLLGDERDIDDIIRIFRKIKENAAILDKQP